MTVLKLLRQRQQSQKHLNLRKSHEDEVLFAEPEQTAHRTAGWAGFIPPTE
jgi:hypothetical protein